MLIIIFAISGLIFGSFLNVLIFRLGRKGGLLWGRSECQRCKTQLGWLDMVPIISFIFLKKRCRYCKGKISYVYPAVEMITGLLFVVFYLKLGIPVSIDLSYQFLLMFVLIAIIFFDYLYYVIPDKIVIPLNTIALVLAWTSKQLEFINLLTSGLLFGCFFAILYLVSHGRWIGLGDAKLSLLIGLSFGYPGSFFIMTASIWTAALVGLLLISLKKASFKSELPLGLFISTFSIIYILFQNEIQTFQHLFY